MKFELKNITGLMALLLVVPALSHARGGDGSGGGAQIESAFRTRAAGLIDRISRSSAADALCSANTLQATLDSARIDIVDQLIDPQTHRQVTRPNLDAWTTPGYIQLLKGPWTHYVDPAAIVTGRSVDVLILHELFRATGGACLDDNFVNTDRIFPLLAQLQAKYSKTFQFSCNATAQLSGYNQNHGSTYYSTAIFCDQVPENGQPVSCMFLEYYGGFSESPRDMGVVQAPFTSDPLNFAKAATLDLKSKTLTESQLSAISTLLQFISPSQPFYVVIDTQTGTWFYGLDKSNLDQL